MLCIKCTHTHTLERIHRITAHTRTPFRMPTCIPSSTTNDSIFLSYILGSSFSPVTIFISISSNERIVSHTTFCNHDDSAPIGGTQEIFIYNLIYIRNEFSVRNAVDWWQFHGITLLIIGNLHSTAV